jgi:hypothetical protein
MKRRLASMPATMALLLAACGAGATVTGGGNPGAPTQPAVGVGQTAPATGPTGVGAAAIDVCQVLGVADTQPLFTTTITATEDTSQTGDRSACSYQVNPHDGHAPMTIEVVVGNQASTYVESFHGGNGGPYIDIPNVGDQAFRVAGQVELVALKGTTACSIQPGFDNSSHYAGLASPDSQGNIPDDSATAFVEKLVPLCEKIFAAGH